jgi:outer membrane protein assembly factor BamB
MHREKTTHATRLRAAVNLTAAGILLSIVGPTAPALADGPPRIVRNHDHARHGGGVPHHQQNGARNLRRAWETFNDDALVSEPTPTGFVLEDALGLVFPAPVVGVTGSPIVRDGTIYYVDQLGTVFARDAATGMALDPAVHWTTTLVDPDFAAGDPPAAPELFYTAPIVTDDYIWLVGAVFGRVHLVERIGGAEVDFFPDTPEIDPFVLAADRVFASVLGDPLIIHEAGQTLLIVNMNVIVNDALAQGHETGLTVAYDITEPTSPVEVWARPTIDIDPATGFPYGTGVSVTSSLVVDQDRGLIFGGTSQNTSYPYDGYPDPDLAPAGYIDRGDSLYAIDYATGEYVWTNQFHIGDVFDLNDPVGTGPNNPDGPRDADVLAPPVLFSARIQGHWRDLVGDGSKGGLFRVVDRDTGETVWERQISQPTGIGGIQGGAAFADGVVYVAGYEGIDDGFSDAQFGISFDTGLFPNAFFATFSPHFWADVEDTAPDNDPATGMRTKVYALNARNGHSRWHFPGGRDYVELLAGSSMRHVTVDRGLVYVATSSGQLFVLRARTGEILFSDQTPDLNDVLDLGLGKPHHASMNSGTVIADDMVFVAYGAQNNPSGGIVAYEVNHRPSAANDVVNVHGHGTVVIDALGNDVDPDGDRLQFVRVAGWPINTDDGQPDIVHRLFGTFVVYNPGDDSADPDAAYLTFTPSWWFHGSRRVGYTIADMAPNRVVNGVELDEPNPTHTPLRAHGRIRLR